MEKKQDIQALITKDEWDSHKEGKVKYWYINDSAYHYEGVVIVMDFNKRRIQLTLSTPKLKELLSLIPGERVALAEASDHGLVRTE